MDFVIDGIHYRAGRLSAMDAFHVARRFSLAIFMLTQNQSRTPEEYARSIVLTSAQVPQADADFVMAKCLSTVNRQQTGGAWAPLTTPNGDLMFADIPLMTLMQILYHVLESNGLVSFFSVPQSPSETPPEQPTS